MAIARNGVQRIGVLSRRHHLTGEAKKACTFDGLMQPDACRLECRKAAASAAPRRGGGRLDIKFSGCFELKPRAV